MRKIISFFAFVAIVFSFAACGGKDGNVPDINGGNGNGNNNGGNGEQANEIAALPGKFTINPDGDQVQFSPGCLYGGPVGVTFWMNHIGHGANTPGCYFSWGTGDDPTYRGTKSKFVDWGLNPVLIEKQGEGWRTLSADEWMHLFSGRDHAKYLCGFAEVQHLSISYRGCLLFPDNAYEQYFSSGRLNLPDNMIFKPYAISNLFIYGESTNKYSAAEWEKLERGVGAVFIREIGQMAGTSYLHGPGYDAVYCWTSTPTDGDDTKAKCLVMQDGFTFSNVIRDVVREIQNPVRLVKNVPQSE